MSEKYELVKYYYDNDFWDDRKVRRAVVQHWITAEEYKLITGKDYE